MLFRKPVKCSVNSRDPVTLQYQYSIISRVSNQMFLKFLIMDSPLEVGTIEFASRPYLTQVYL